MVAAPESVETRVLEKTEESFQARRTAKRRAREMIDRLLYVLTATALLLVLMFDQTFAENLFRAFGPVDIMSHDPWLASVAGIFLVLAVAALIREARR